MPSSRGWYHLKNEQGGEGGSLASRPSLSFINAFQVLMTSPGLSEVNMGRERKNIQASIHDLCADRYSGRAFDQRAVDAEELVSCLEAARWAPSCYNDQPWRFLVTDLYVDNGAWQRLVCCLSPGNRRWASRAPVLILVSASERFSHDGSPNRWGTYDTGQAAISLCLQATALGLITHQMGGFEMEKVKTLFAIPDGFTPMSVIALGYPADPADLEEDLQQRETMPRQRKSLQEIVWMNRWGVPYQPSAFRGESDD